MGFLAPKNSVETDDGEKADAVQLEGKNKSSNSLSMLKSDLSKPDRNDEAEDAFAA